LRGLLYVHQASNLLRERERHIQSLERELAEARGQRDEMMRIDAELARHLEEQNRWGLELDQELQVARGHLDRVQKELGDRTAWAISLNERVQDLTQRVEIFEARWNMMRESRWIKLGRKIGVGPQIDQENTTSGGGSGGAA
jgi:chromosome segregation ATPase